MGAGGKRNRPVGEEGWPNVIRWIAEGEGLSPKLPALLPDWCIN